MSKLGKKVVFRNTTGINQTVQRNGGWVTVIPGGTIEDFERGPLSYIRGFKVVKGAPTQGEHVAKLANDNAAPDVPRPDGTEYPVHLGGGKWELSDGTVTAAHLKRVEAEELQAQVDAAQKVKAESEESSDSAEKADW